jgi:hypothetical protein
MLSTTLRFARHLLKSVLGPDRVASLLGKLLLELCISIFHLIEVHVHVIENLFGLLFLHVALLDL